MSRFMDNLNGKYGDYWKKDAEKELEKRRAELINGEVLFSYLGVATWKSNGRVVPREIAEQFKLVTDLIDIESCNKARDKEIEKFVSGMKNHRITDEEKAEIDANFDKGTVVYNILTGEKYIAK